MVSELGIIRPASLWVMRVKSYGDILGKNVKHTPGSYRTKGSHLGH